MQEVRDVSGDPSAMLALAHPTRLALLELLGADGPLTASEAGVRLGESPGTMSWHLRLLARHGFVLEAEGGSGRRRPWTIASRGTRWDSPPRSEPERAAADLLTSLTVERMTTRLRGWLARRHTAPPDWQAAAAVSDWTLYLTVEEAQQLRDDIYQLLARFDDRASDAELRPPDARACRALVNIFPYEFPTTNEPTA